MDHTVGQLMISVRDGEEHRFTLRFCGSLIRRYWHSNSHRYRADVGRCRFGIVCIVMGGVGRLSHRGGAADKNAAAVKLGVRTKRGQWWLPG
jgi:hypothetical protein